MPATRTPPRPRSSARRTGDFAIAQLSDGRLLAGTGPLRRSPTPADSGISFYVNDFALSDPEPWRIPASWAELDSPVELGACAGTPLPELDWQLPSREGFAEVFEAVRQALDAGEIVKAVGAVAARAPIPAHLDLAAALIAAAKDPGRSSWLYGFQEGDEGFVGLTPERLFQLDDETLSTMALAGTAAPERGDHFANDPKEQHEHRLVVEALRRRLAEFGEAAEGDQEILDVGGMIHFLTTFKVQPRQRPEIDRVIAALHPTPALGVAPRTAQSLHLLAGLREKMGVPAAYGAPFGVKLGSRFEAFVAIRGIFWAGGQASLPTGCGLLKGSQVDREWEELALKRRWVRAAFGMQ